MDNVDKVVYNCKIKGFYPQYTCGKIEIIVDKRGITKMRYVKNRKIYIKFMQFDRLKKRGENKLSDNVRKKTEKQMYKEKSSG